MRTLFFRPAGTDSKTEERLMSLNKSKYIVQKEEAQILFLDGKTIKDVAEHLRVSVSTAWKIRKQLKSEGIIK